jgi:sec-independent protein translocase protein TatA
MWEFWAGRFFFCVARNLPSAFTYMNTPLFAFGLGGQEIFLIFLAVLFLFGAKKIPELARGLGKSMGEFKKARQEFDDELQRSADVDKKA